MLPVQDTVQRAISFNRSQERRLAATAVLLGSEDEPAMQRQASNTLSPTPSLPDLASYQSNAQREPPSAASHPSPSPLKPPEAAPLTQRQEDGAPPSHDDDSSKQPPQPAHPPVREAIAARDDSSAVRQSPPPGAEHGRDASSRASSDNGDDAEAGSAVLDSPEQQQQQQQQSKQKHLPIALAYGTRAPGGGLGSMRPALLRQEAEGGKLLVAALLRCNDSGLIVKRTSCIVPDSREGSTAATLPSSPVSVVDGAKGGLIVKHLCLPDLCL